MSKFLSGVVYRHDTAKDLDILVVKVRYRGEKKSKLLIKWISQASGNILTFPGGRMDGTDNITVNSKDYVYWKVLGKS